VLLSGVVFAEDSDVSSNITSQLCNIKSLINAIIPTVALIMFLLAGLIYAAGQTFGAEMKAKSQGWAMSLLVGGIIGIVIAVMAPWLVNLFIGMQGDTGGLDKNPCDT